MTEPAALPVAGAIGDRNAHQAPLLSRNGRATLTVALLLLPGLAVVAFALVWPFLTMVQMSFFDRYPDPESWTVERYGSFFGDAYFLRISLRTFALAATVAFLTAVIGYPVAWYLAHSPSRWKHLVFLGVISPLLVSIVVRTIGWTIILGSEGLVNNVLMSLGIVSGPVPLLGSFWSVVVGMVHVLLPFMVLSIATVLGKIDPSFGEAAAILGANSVQRFTRIILPLSINGLAAGSVIVFCLTIGSYITPLWLGRGSVPVLAMTVHEQMVVLVDWPMGATVSIVLTVGMLIAILAYGLVLRKHARR